MTPIASAWFAQRHDREHLDHLAAPAYIGTCGPGELVTTTLKIRRRTSSPPARQASAASAERTRRPAAARPQRPSGRSRGARAWRGRCAATAPPGSARRPAGRPGTAATLLPTSAAGAPSVSASRTASGHQRAHGRSTSHGVPRARAATSRSAPETSGQHHVVDRAAVLGADLAEVLQPRAHHGEQALARHPARSAGRPARAGPPRAAPSDAADDPANLPTAATASPAPTGRSRRSPSAAHGLAHRVEHQLRRPGLAARDPLSRPARRGSAAASRMTWPMSIVPTPSTIAWWVLVTSATRPRVSPSTRYASQSGRSGPAGATSAAPPGRAAAPRCRGGAARSGGRGSSGRSRGRPPRPAGPAVPGTPTTFCR